jgi:hypothetical protein
MASFRAGTSPTGPADTSNVGIPIDRRNAVSLYHPVSRSRPHRFAFIPEIPRILVFDSKTRSAPFLIASFRAAAFTLRLSPMYQCVSAVLPLLRGGTRKPPQSHTKHRQIDEDRAGWHTQKLSMPPTSSENPPIAQGTADVRLARTTPCQSIRLSKSAAVAPGPLESLDNVPNSCEKCKGFSDC